MATHIDLGNQGEDIAVQFLIQKGCTILYRNFKYKRGEIDIIARTIENKLIFVEVKTRFQYDKPEEAVTFKKEKKLFETAMEYKISQDLVEETFFDIIAIRFKDKLNYEITHFEDLSYEFDN